jgi:hypothetical protein
MWLSAGPVDDKGCVFHLNVKQTDVDARFSHFAWLGLWRDMEREARNDSIGLDAAERLP